MKLCRSLLLVIVCVCLWAVPAFGQEHADPPRSPDGSTPDPSQRNSDGAASVRKNGPTKEEQSQAKAAAPNEPTITVFSLRYIQPDWALMMIQSMLGKKPDDAPPNVRRVSPRLAADNRMNRLIVFADQPTKRTIEALLLKLDQPEERAQNAKARLLSIHLKFADPKSVQAAMQQLSLASVESYADERTKTVIVKGPEEAMAEVATLVTKLDIAPPGERPRQGVLLRIVWLVDKSLADAEAAPIPEEWKTPIERLRKQLGFGELRTATQIVVGLDPVNGAQFESTATAKLKQSWVLEASGRISQNVPGKRQLRLQLSAQPVGTKQELCKLDTTCSGALQWQPMIVGMTMVGSQPSVFVIQFLPE
jgi:hypothetical protein